jgi:hypothetical protein
MTRDHHIVITGEDGAPHVAKVLREGKAGLLPKENTICPIAYEEDGKQTWLVVHSKRDGRLHRLSLSPGVHIEGQLAPLVGPVKPFVEKAVYPHFQEQSKNQAVLHREILLTVVQQWAKEVPLIDSFRRKGSGAHILVGAALVVSGSRILFWQSGQLWRELPSPVIYTGGANYLAECAAGDDWLPFTVDQLNRPLSLDALAALKLLEGLLRAAWKFEQDSDYILHALLPFAFTVADLFPHKPTIHVMAPSASGKSRLLKGFYGRSPADSYPVGGPFVLNSLTVDDISAAGLEKFDNAAMLLIIDEQEASQQPHVQAVLRVLRSASMAGSRTVRGKADGGTREYFVHFPALVASIESIAEKDQDVNRWIISRPAHEDSRAAPEDVAKDYWSQREVDPREVQRTIFKWSLENAAELRRAYGRAGADTTEVDIKASSHYKEVLLPALAVARAILPNDEYLQVASKLCGEKSQSWQEARSVTGEGVWEMILNTDFLPAFGEDGLTVEQALEQGLNRSSRTLGVAVQEGAVYVSLQAFKSKRLLGTEYQKLTVGEFTTALERAGVGEVKPGVFRGIGGTNQRRWVRITLRPSGNGGGPCDT